MENMSQTEVVNTLQKQLTELETEYSQLQQTSDIPKLCTILNKIKHVKEKLRNCKWNGRTQFNFSE